MSNSLSASSTVVATSDHVSSNLGGEEVILELTEGTYYGLNEVGAEVWNRLSSPRQVSALCAELNEEYDVEPDVLEQDILDLLAEMHERGLIRIVSG